METGSKYCKDIDADTHGDGETPTPCFEYLADCSIPKVIP